MAWILRTLEGIARRNPRLAYLRLGPERVWMLTHPELVHELVVLRGRQARKGRTSEKIKVLLGEGLLTSEGEHHRRQRRLIQPCLHRERLESYGEAMRETAETWSERWRRLPNAQTVDMTREMSALTLTIIGRVLFGRTLSARDITEVGDCLRTLMGGLPWQLVPGAGTLLELPLPTNRRRFAAADRLKALTDRLLAERRNGLVDAFDELPPEQIRDETITLLLAGHETTANALSWAWLLLSEHPSVAEWMAADVRQRAPAVFAESIRLFPPAWIMARRLETDLELDGRVLRSGSLAVASQWVLHRDPRFWPDARAFRPERWMTATGFSRTAPDVPKGAWLPFGIGSRSCVGQEFAWLEGSIGLETLAGRWAPRLVDGSRVRVLPTITLRPRDGLPMCLTEK